MPFGGRLTALTWLRGYGPGWLRADVIAGITLAAYLLPAAQGDASLAWLPPPCGAVNHSQTVAAVLTGWRSGSGAAVHPFDPAGSTPH